MARGNDICKVRTARDVCMHVAIAFLASHWLFGWLAHLRNCLLIISAAVPGDMAVVVVVVVVYSHFPFMFLGQSKLSTCMYSGLQKQERGEIE